MDWITTVNGLIALITGLVGLIGTGVGAFFAIKSWIKATKEKSAKEIWAMIVSIADGAIQEAERLAKEGKMPKTNKKEYVISMVKVACKNAGIEIELFIDQLSDYIDQTITFVNGMTK